MKTLALYYRASNEDKNLGLSATIQNQRDLLHSYVKNKKEFNDWNVIEFLDDGWSGTTFERPGIQELLKMAGKEIQCIIVKDFSRFGRNLIEVGNYLDQVFPFLGVRFIAVNDNYDSNNSVGQTIGLDVSLKAMIYEMYSRDLSKKISSVKERQMKNGRYAGSWSFYGYKRSKVSASGLEIDPEAAKIVKKIFSLAVEGVKTTQIAALLNQEGVLPPLSYRREKNPDEAFYSNATEYNVWTRQRIRAIIRDERYTGVLISKKRQRQDISTNKTKRVEPSNWIRVDDALDAIITKSEFEQAQRLFVGKNYKYTITSNELFRGFVKCGYCGKALTKISTKFPYFCCEMGKYRSDMPCTKVQVDKNRLEKIILTSLQSHIQLIHQKKSVSTDANTPDSEYFNQLEHLQKEINKYKTQQVILFEQFADGNMERESFSVEKQIILKKLEELSAERNILLNKFQEGQTTEKKCDFEIYDFSHGLSRELLNTFVKVIRVYQDGVIKIDWNFSDIFVK